ncbi:hypothetical protein EDB84DRAFT_1577438 [Lactarius hengduanensis]|nr:hypothetical protein EDB84DRAFT_1577438 [Lactarius hengduanensis]
MPSASLSYFTRINRRKTVVVSEGDSSNAQEVQRALTEKQTIFDVAIPASDTSRVAALNLTQTLCLPLDRARENVPGDHIQMTVIEIRYPDVYEITGGVHDSRADDKGGREHNRRGHSRHLDAAEPGRERAEAEARTRRFGGPDGSAFMGRYFMGGADAAYSIISLERHEDEATAVNGREGDGRHCG